MVFFHGVILTSKYHPKIEGEEEKKLILSIFPKKKILSIIINHSKISQHLNKINNMKRV